MKRVIIGLGIINLIAMAPLTWAAVLGSPNKGVNLSGIGFISGWKCDASDITITINGGEHQSVAMHQERLDLFEVCGGTVHHGFIKHVNWAILGDGEHLVVAYDEGVEFDRAEFTVGTLGEEFPKGLEGQAVVEGFPSPNEQTVLKWNESTQHFEVLYVTGGAPVNDYNLTYWSEFYIDYQTAVIWDPELIFAKTPNENSCQAGELTETAKNRALEAVNQIRALHGLSPLRYSTFYDNQMQEASLIQEANNYGDHYPDPTLKCYTEEGREGSATSNISLSSANLDPAAHIVHLANDANPAILPAAVGHRRWILNPFVTYFSFGQVGKYATQKVIGFSQEPAFTPQIDVDFVAFPYETYPSNLLIEDPPWSFSAIVDKNSQSNNQGDFFRNAAIAVTRASDKVELPIYNRYTDTFGYGLPNFMSWQVDGWNYNTLYEVEIKNVVLNDGSTRDYSYSVFIKLPDIDN